MNKTKIEWCDSTWNPVTGCYHGCPYCYARNMINRFSGKAYITAPAEGVKEINEPVKDENGKRIPFGATTDKYFLYTALTAVQRWRTEDETLNLICGFLAGIELFGLLSLW